MAELTGKTLIITGASLGIGQALALVRILTNHPRRPQKKIMD
ncbi:MAG: hypothetical protein ACYC6G_11850 [Desulfobaccales bacterium]